MFLVYALHNGDGLPRYIGVTAQPLPVRLAGHRCDVAKGGQTRKCRWMRSVEKDGTVEIAEIDRADDRLTVWQLERVWITMCRSMGASLTNATAGGEGLCEPTEDTREAMRAAWARMTPEARKMRGRKIGAKRRGHKASAEARRNMSLAHQGHKRSAETIAKHRATMAANKAAGKPRKSTGPKWSRLTPEQRERQLRGVLDAATKPRTAAQIAQIQKLCAAKKGSTATEATKAKQSLSMKAVLSRLSPNQLRARGLRANGATPEARSEKARRAAIARWSRLGQ